MLRRIRGRTLWIFDRCTIAFARLIVRERLRRRRVARGL